MNILSGVFWNLSIIAYIFYSRNKRGQNFCKYFASIFSIKYDYFFSLEKRKIKGKIDRRRCWLKCVKYQMRMFNSSGEIDVINGEENYHKQNGNENIDFYKWQISFNICYIAFWQTNRFTHHSFSTEKGKYVR